MLLAFFRGHQLLPVGEGDGILTLGQDGMGSLILNKWKHGVGAPDEDLHILTQAPIMYG